MKNAEKGVKAFHKTVEKGARSKLNEYVLAYAPRPNDQRHSQESKQNIGNGTCQSGQRHTALGIAKVARVDRHGLRPAKTEQHHTDGTDGIQMTEWV